MIGHAVGRHLAKAVSLSITSEKDETACTTSSHNDWLNAWDPRVVEQPAEFSTSVTQLHKRFSCSGDNNNVCLLVVEQPTLLSTTISL